MLALIDSPYTKTPDAVYSVFHHVQAAVPGARYGGAYTLKPGFHSSVEDNLERWPGNYSIRDAINRREPRAVGRALDLTLSTTEMKTRTGYLRDAAADDDPRLACVREFYGTTNGTSVFGRAHTGPDTGWYSSSADSSHLWHIHLSFFTPYVDDWDALAGVVSVLKGESLADFLEGTMAQLNLPAHGDTGSYVGLWQRNLLKVGLKLPQWGVDNSYGDEVRDAVLKWYLDHGGDPSKFDGKAITSWVASTIEDRLRELAETPAPGPTQAQVDAAVAAYLKANPLKLPSSVTFTGGNLTGFKAS